MMEQTKAPDEGLVSGSEHGDESLSLLQRAARAFGSRLLLASSLGPQSLVIIDLAHRHGLSLDVALIDTGLLFAETLRLAETVEARYGLRIHRVEPARTVAEQSLTEGGQLWSHDPNRCCQLRKVEPLRELLSHYGAWVTGLRRDQSQDRSQTPSVEWDENFGVVKFSPLAHWSRSQVDAYLQHYEVPSNPLLQEGYRSIGCAPCTHPVGDGPERAGRWAGIPKTECGLHTRLALLRTPTQDSPSGDQP